MNKRIEKMIKMLLVDDEAKAFLRTADRVLNSGSVSIRNNAFVPLVVAGEGCGFSSFGRVYSEIVDASRFQTIRGTASFLELVFPKDNERDERLFFASPRRAASTRNRFYGTMLISFKEYAGKDLIESSSLEKLLKFMDENKANIRYVLHIMPGFTAESKLIALLQDVVNVTEIHLDKPGIDNGFLYMMEGLKSQGVEVAEDVKKCIKEKALPNIVERKSYSGYKTLNAFMERLKFEAAMALKNGECRVDKTVLDILLDKMEKEEADKNESPRMGFGN